MALRTLGSVDLLNPSFDIPVQTESGVPTYEETWERIRNTSEINLGQFCKATQPFVFDISISGVGSWQTILDFIAVIQAELDAAADYSMHQIGTQIVYSEQFGDQGAASTWKVVFGKVWELRQWRALEPEAGGPRTRIHVELLCEPGPVA